MGNEKKLIIAEKPSMGRTIAAALHADQKQDGYLEGSEYVVSWCFGHLYEIYDLEKYINPEYKKGDKVRWTMDKLPFYPEDWQFRYEAKEDCKKQIGILKKLLNRKDVGTIYAAGDPDREGEVIVRRVIDNTLDSGKPVYRLWLPTLTADSIKNGIKTAQMDRGSYAHLFDAGAARAAVDWMIGIDLTRYASIKTNALINIGRCVCPIVNQVVQREKEIKDFKPEKYLALVSKETTKGVEVELTSKTKFTPEQLVEAQQLAERLNAAGAQVTELKRTKKEIKSGKLFSLSDLQSFVCKADHALSPQNVLDATQALYEKGFVTYPRTASNYLGKSESSRVDRILTALQQAGYENIKNKDTKDIYDDSKVEAHSALTPTEKIPSSFDNSSQQLVYESIRNRFLAAFCSISCEVNRTEMDICCGEEEFHISGDVQITPGWRQYEADGKKDKALPDVEKGDYIAVKFTPAEKETTPPKRYTVASLTSWMLTPMRGAEKPETEEYSDKEWKDILSEATICTEATRAGTIDKCIKGKYISLEKGSYKALEKGFLLVDVMNDLHIDLSVQKTVDLSRNLHEIAAGKMRPEEIFEQTKEMIDEVFSYNGKVDSSHAASAGNTKEVIGKCPKCGAPVYEAPKSFYCSKSQECGFTIWKESKGLTAMKTKITNPRAKSLLSKGRVYVKGLYSAKKDKKFDAWLVLDTSGKYANYKLEFDKK